MDDIMDLTSSGQWGEYDNGNYHVSISLEDGTKIRETEDDEFNAAFAENIDIKITDRCTGTNCPMCHEGSSSVGRHAGKIYEQPWFDTLHPYQEVALGGGNVLEYPYLIVLLEKLKEKKVIANITVHEKHFLEDFELLQEMQRRELVHGIGVSMKYPSAKLIKKIKELDNVVIHTVLGVTPYRDYKELMNKGLKVLILGFKDLRRGVNYRFWHDKIMKSHTTTVARRFEEMREGFDVVSYDNLAIEQLRLKDRLTKDEWDEFYMGDEGQFTFFIDAVSGVFAKNSVAPFEERFPLLDSVDDMFQKVKNG